MKMIRKTERLRQELHLTQMGNKLAHLDQIPRGLGLMTLMMILMSDNHRILYPRPPSPTMYRNMYRGMDGCCMCFPYFSSDATSDDDDRATLAVLLQKKGIQSGQRIARRQKRIRAATEHLENELVKTSTSEDLEPQYTGKDEEREEITAVDDTLSVCLPQEEDANVEKDSESTEEDTDHNEQEGLWLQDWDKWATCLAAGKKSAAHIHSPEHLNIIRCGAGISRSEYMPRKLYASLQKCFPACGQSFFIEHHAYIMDVLQQKTLQALRETLISKRPPADEDRGSKYYFLHRIFSQFVGYVFKLDRDSQIQSSEACYIWHFGHVSTLHGEINLIAVDEMRRLQKQNEQQHKADGVIYINESNIELMFLETTGHYRLVDRPRKGWDHVKGMHGCLAMLGRIARLFAHGSVDEYMNIKVMFLHAHDNELHLWTVCVPSAGTYIMQRVAKAVVPDSFSKLLHIVSTINLF
ncbi:hypothetical protein BC936DRAFT_138079 [Jimgerdemannia flammicorona]|uniref:Uncharacterized protein n=1 Tax=Jimgerdemannia flammicorona TaxID=994334 RepID=A0A433DIJ8_9FUNG|nr:hypothetical protein BC936DRAFT_138079 [Jimgerdemannia flammicorona]